MALLSYIKQLIPSTLKASIRSRLGIPSQQKSFNNLKKSGISPKIVLDIGAYEGNWARDLKNIFPDAQILMIEGQTSKSEILKTVCKNNTGIDYHIALLGASSKLVNFNIYDTASSVLEENNQTEAIKEERELICLDNLLLNSLYHKPDMIKIDTQGYELEVLKGSENTLKYASMVLLEVSLIDIYRDCPLVADVLAFMAERDFVLFDICSLMHRPLDGALYQSDFLFVKKDSILRKNKKWI
ncbi:FkbM family methyltransferase [Daejeonella oryzae]|uniref:FkbM family methyltransferase n=1 Tax=Daejeonella oryzae TaxID=1122943 RepID=UPI00041BF182|nr:FkbM family methyltransferase [Daejeonella oryzae]